jgi:phosphoglycolate phosphatase-like HAD superfamily hydrolase
VRPRYTPTMRVLALDFDGVLSDSAHEVVLVAAGTWLGLEPASRLRPELERMLASGQDGLDDNPLARRFRELMPLGNRAEDFGAALAVLERGLEITDQAAYDAFRAGLDPAWLEAFHRRFYAERTSLRRRDPAAWVALHRPYRPFLDLLRRRADEVELAVATAKDRESVRILNQSYGVADLLPDERVWDKEAGASKVEHLTAIARRFAAATAEVTFVDDKLNHLEAVQPLGVRGVLAAWGFNSEREVEGARAEGFPVATLENAETVLFGSPPSAPGIEPCAETATRG